MNRREFLKISCSGLITLYLSGCGLNMQSGPCVHKDDIETEAIQKFMEADVIALVSPVYYFALTAQLKTVIDRFYSRTYDINGKQSVLLAAGGSDTPLTMRSITKHYGVYALAGQGQGACTGLPDTRSCSQNRISAESI